MKIAILTSTLLSLSLLTVSLSAGKNMVCKDGKCFMDLSQLDNDSKEEKVQKNLFKHNKVTISNRSMQRLEVFSFAKSKYHKQPNETLEILQNSNIETIVLTPDKYIMTDREQAIYEAEHIELTLPDRDTENKIIEKTKLPTSEYFCEKNQKLIYQTETDSFECA